MKIHPAISIQVPDCDVAEAPAAHDPADEQDREGDDLRPLDPEFLAWLEELL